MSKGSVWACLAFTGPVEQRSDELDPVFVSHAQTACTQGRGRTPQDDVLRVSANSAGW